MAKRRNPITGGHDLETEVQVFCTDNAFQDSKLIGQALGKAVSEGVFLSAVDSTGTVNLHAIAEIIKSICESYGGGGSAFDNSIPQADFDYLLRFAEKLPKIASHFEKSDRK